MAIKIQCQQSNWPSRSSGYKLLLSCRPLKIHRSASDLATPIIPVRHITALILPLNVPSPLAVTCASASVRVTTTLSHRARTQTRGGGCKSRHARVSVDTCGKKKKNLFFPPPTSMVQRVHRKVHREMQGHKHTKSGSTGWRGSCVTGGERGSGDTCTCNI